MFTRRSKDQSDKEQRMSDWSRPDLSEEQIQYAATDVEVLPTLASYLTRELRERELLDLARGCWEHIPIRVELEVRQLGDVFSY